MQTRNLAVTRAENVFIPPVSVSLSASERDFGAVSLARGVFEQAPGFSEIAFAPETAPSYDVGLFSRHRIIVYADGAVWLRSENPESGEFVDTLVSEVFSGAGQE